MKVKNVRVSEEMIYRLITFTLMISVLTATYYAAYVSEYVFQNTNPILSGLSVILSFVSMAFTVIFCISLFVA